MEQPDGFKGAFDDFILLGIPYFYIFTILSDSYDDRKIIWTYLNSSVECN